MGLAPNTPQSHTHKVQHRAAQQDVKSYGHGGVDALREEGHVDDLPCRDGHAEGGGKPQIPQLVGLWGDVPQNAEGVGQRPHRQVGLFHPHHGGDDHDGQSGD